MDTRVTQSHPNYEKLMDLKRQVGDMYYKATKIQKCVEKTSRDEIEAHKLFADNIEEIGERIEFLGQQWGEKYMQVRTSNAPNSGTKNTEQNTGISSSSDIQRPIIRFGPINPTHKHYDQIKDLEEEEKILRESIYNMEKSRKDKYREGTSGYSIITARLTNMSEQAERLKARRECLIRDVDLPRQNREREKDTSDNRQNNADRRNPNITRITPSTTNIAPPQNSSFTPELMLQMGTTIATAIADSITTSLGERTINTSQILSRAKPVRQKAETFNGELKEGLDRLEDYEVVAANNGWDNDQKATSARFALQGPAEDWFKGIWPNDPPTWIEFVLAFRREYTPTGYKAALQQKLFATRKEKNETYNDVYLRVRRLCRRAFPDAE